MEIIDYVSFGATEDYSHLMTVVQENGGIGTYMMIGTELSSGHHDFTLILMNQLGYWRRITVRTVVDLIGKVDLVQNGV